MTLLRTFSRSRDKVSPAGMTNDRFDAGQRFIGAIDLFGAWIWSSKFPRQRKRYA
jgi:hypothetical protein